MLKSVNFLTAKKYKKEIIFVSVAINKQIIGQ